MKQLVPLFSLTARRVFCLFAIAVVALLAIRSIPTTHANRNPSGHVLTPLGPLPSPPVGLTLTVNTLGDQSDVSVGDGICDIDSGTPGEQCTLRAALLEANSTQTTDVDTINFSVTGTINLTGGLPTVFAFTHINGPGSSLLTVRRDTGGDYGIFFTFGNGISISGLTVTNGRTPDGTAGNNGSHAPDGGGINNSGTLTMTDVVVTGNSTGVGGNGINFGGNGGRGAGIYNSGTLTMTNCVVSFNTAGRGGTGNIPGNGGAGGGIFDASTLNMTNCTVNGNTAGTGGDGSQTSGSGGTGGSGGGICSDVGTMNLTGVNITNNAAGNSGNGISGGGHGGGIGMTSSGVLTISNSTIAGNVAGSGQAGNGFGGGIGLLSAWTMIATNITVSGNTSGGIAGGIMVQASSAARLTNSTVSGNTASQVGGGLYNDSGTTMALTNTTVAGNSAPAGSGIITAGGSARLRNTIVAFNGTGGAGPDTEGSFTSQGHNLIGYANGSGPGGGGPTGFNGPGDQVGTMGAPLDPHLGPLADNGGPTKTHALLPDSTALDAGDDCVTQIDHCGDSTISQLSTDQRGSVFNRIVDGPDPDSTATVDIGAYEKQRVFPNLADATTNEDTQAIVAFDVDDIASVTSVTATSSNPTLVPNNLANISVETHNSTAVLTINPAANLWGSTNITVTVNRASGSTNATFVLTVVSVNDAPSFTKGPDQSVNENDPAQTVNNWATAISPGPADESGQTVTFQIVNNSNASLFSAAPAISSNGTLTYTPATGVSGTALITIRLSDNGGTANGGSDSSATQTFNINVLDGGVLSFGFLSYSVSENGGSAIISVQRLGGSAGEARINYTTSNNTATAGQDYMATSGTLIFPNGVTNQSFLVPIINDVFDENDETVVLALTNASGSGSSGFPSAVTLTIIDDDPRPTLSINDVQLLEGNSGTSDAVFTVTLTGQTALQVTVGFATSNNTATFSDYQPTSGQLTFNPGETTKTIAVSVVGDTMGESNETFFVNLNFSTNANITRFRGTGTILNDDTSTQFSSATYSINEGVVSVSFPVQRTGNTSGSSTVAYTTSDGAGSAACSAATGNASEKCDYAATSGTLTFAPGETSKTFVVPLVDDGWLEGNESFMLTLSSPTGATLGSPNSATVTIVDNDLAGAIPILFVENGTNYAVALNSVTFVRGPFSVFDPYNFSADGRARLILFTSNLKLNQADPAYLSVQASGVDLPIEKVGAVTGVAGLDASYLIVKLSDNLPSGDLQLTVTLRGSTSNASILQIAP